MNYYWKEEEFITGDNLESLGDFVFDVGNYLYGDHGRVRTTKSERQLIEEQIVKINDLKPRVIYVYGHDTKRFLPEIKNIHHEFVLITHNSDLGIYPEYIPYIDDKIIKWFGQNNYIEHPKVITLPIGIARGKYQHGNVKLLSEKSKNTDKSILVYKNFAIETNSFARTKVDEVTTKNGIVMLPKVPHSQYLDFVSKSAFTISPPGNGIDCHRIWESLYLKTIPVVQNSIAFNQFQDLPILFINSWEEVTVDFLRKNVKYIDRLNTKLEKLHFSYWQNLIKNL